MILISSVNQILAILTVVGQIIIVSLLILFFLNRKTITRWLGKNVILFSFVVVLIATLGSLFYSEIAGYEPCKLCWFQRILMYPQTILLGMAFWKKDRGIVDYVLALSVIGAIIAGYHYLLQIGAAPELPCSAVGYSVSCAQRFVMQLGYITIPMMALTSFLLVIFFMISIKKTKYE